MNKDQLQETALLRSKQGRSLYPGFGEHKAAHTATVTSPRTAWSRYHISQDIVTVQLLYWFYSGKQFYY